MKETLIQIEPKWFETCGKYSLLGRIGNELMEGDKLIIVFLLTSDCWRKKNRGAWTTIVPEFAIPCFLRDLETLRRQGVMIEIKTDDTWWHPF